MEDERGVRDERLDRWVGMVVVGLVSFYLLSVRICCM